MLLPMWNPTTDEPVDLPSLANLGYRSMVSAGVTVTPWNDSHRLLSALATASLECDERINGLLTTCPMRVARIEDEFRNPFDKPSLRVKPATLGSIPADIKGIYRISRDKILLTEMIHHGMVQRQGGVYPQAMEMLIGMRLHRYHIGSGEWDTLPSKEIPDSHAENVTSMVSGRLIAYPNAYSTIIPRVHVLTSATIQGITATTDEKTPSSSSSSAPLESKLEQHNDDSQDEFPPPPRAVDGEWRRMLILNESIPSERSYLDHQSISFTFTWGGYMFFMDGQYHQLVGYRVDTESGECTSIVCKVIYRGEGAGMERVIAHSVIRIV